MLLPPSGRHSGASCPATASPCGSQTTLRWKRVSQPEVRGNEIVLQTTPRKPPGGKLKWPRKNRPQQKKAPKKQKPARARKKRRRRANRPPKKLRRKNPKKERAAQAPTRAASTRASSSSARAS